MEAPRLTAERARIRKLASFHILDTPAEDRFDRIARMAAEMMETPFAFIAFVDRDRVWNKACFGAEVRQYQREVAFCAHTILSDDVLVVEDAREDVRFADNPFVLNDHGIRFYLGVPLRTADGFNLGALCVMDTQPRTVSPRECKLLQHLAALVVDELELAQERQRMTPNQTLLSASVEALTDVFFVFDANRRFMRWNRRLSEVTGYTDAEIATMEPGRFFTDEGRALLRSTVVRVLSGQEVKVEADFVTKDGRRIPHEFTGRLLRDAEGKRIGICGIGRDITERRAKEAALQALSHRLEALAEHVPGMLCQFEVHPDGTMAYTYVSGGSRSLFGMEPDVLKQDFEAITPLFHPDDVAGFLETTTASITLRAPLNWIGRILVQHEIRWVHFAARPVEQPSGSVVWYGLVMDVTATKQAELKVREVNERFAALSRNVPGVIFQSRFTRDGRLSFPYISSRTIDVLGLTPEALQQDASLLLNAVHPEDQESLYASIAQSARTLKEWQWEGRALLGKRTLWIRGISQPQLQPDGSILSNGLLIDITSNKFLETALREREAYLSSMISNLPLILTALDVNGRFTMYEGKGIEALGQKPGEIVGLSIYDHFKDQPDVLSLFERAIAGTPQNGLLALGDKTQEYWLRPLFNEAQQVTGVVVISMDVTDRVQTNEQLRDREASYHALFHSVTEAIFVLDEEGRIVDGNKGITALFGYEAKELRGRTFPGLYPSCTCTITDSRSYVQKAFAGQPQRFECTGRRKDDTVFETEAVLTRSRYFGQDVVIAVLRDVSQQKAYAHGLVVAKEKAEEMAKLKDAFLANMSHEIRTPLTGIIGLSEILADEVTGEHRHLVQLMHKSGQRLMETLNSVLDLAQIESQTLTLRPVELDVIAEVQAAVDLFQVRAEEQGLWLRVEPAVPQARAQADPSVLQRILNNLLGNAIKFTESGGVTLAVATEAAHVVLTVTDTGVGISDAFLPHVFDEFKQETMGNTRPFEGSGLGLTITKKLVDLSGGTLDVESTKGLGTTFTIRLPLLEPPPPRIERPRITGRPRVLVVEDSLVNQVLLRQLLRKDYDADLVASGEAALIAAQRQDYDVVLLDISLGGGMDGVDVLKLLRQQPAYVDCPIVAMTAHALPGDAQRFLDQGFDRYLKKPFPQNDLFAVLDDVLARQDAA